MADDLRALDAAVAERVMGWHKTGEFWFDSNGSEMMRTGDDPRNQMRVNRFMPSSDPTACALVKKRLHGAGVWLEITYTEKHVLVTDWRNRDGPSGSAFVEELAVCLLALALAEAGILPKKVAA